MCDWKKVVKHHNALAHAHNLASKAVREFAEDEDICEEVRMRVAVELVILNRHNDAILSGLAELAKAHAEKDDGVILGETGDEALVGLKNMAFDPNLN